LYHIEKEYVIYLQKNKKEWEDKGKRDGWGAEKAVFDLKIDVRLSVR